MFKKVILVIGGLAVLGIVASVFLLTSNLDKIVKVAIETVGTQVLGTSVTVDQVQLELTEGKGQLSGLTIMNPEGFSAAAMLKLGQVGLDIDISSITGPVYVINEILIDGVQVLAEQKVGMTNFDTVMENLESPDTGAGENAPVESDAETEELKLAIGKFTFKNSAARLMSDQLGEYKLDVPAIHVTSLGTKEAPLSPEQIARETLSQLFRQITKAISDSIKDLAKDTAEKAVMDNLAEDDKKRINAAKELFKN